MNSITKTIMGILLIVAVFLAALSVTRKVVQPKQASPATTVAEVSQGPGDTVSPTGINPAAQTAVDREFFLTRPGSVEEFSGALSSVYNSPTPEPLALTRVQAYVALALRETLLAPGRKSLLVPATSPVPTDFDRGDAVIVLGLVAADLLEDEFFADAVASWGVKPDARGQSIVDAVTALAASDGWSKVTSSEAPKYTGELAWKLSPSIAPTAPGFGLLRPILLKESSCIPSTLDRSVLRVDDTVTDTGAVLDSVSIRALQPHTYALAYHAVEGRYSDMVLLLYDAMILTWRAAWTEGLAAPGGVGAVETQNSSVPVYPYWPTVAAGAFEEYARLADVSPADLDSAMQEALALEQLSPNFAKEVEFVSRPSFRWQELEEPAEKFGVCMAAEFRARQS
jgi:hypothetical protein